MIKAIATEYNGYKFRSQLEARWAFFFDSICIPYIYEVDGYKLANGSIWYRPDFWLPSHHRYVEIKPYAPNKAELDKAFYLSLESEKEVYILCGDPYGLIEVHRYTYYSREQFDLLLSYLKDDPEAFSLIDHVTETECIVHSKYDMLRFLIWPDVRKMADALPTDVAEPIVDFQGGLRKDDVLWDKVMSRFDLYPEITALIPNEMVRARMHQFWKPRDRKP